MIHTYLLQDNCFRSFLQFTVPHWGLVLRVMSVLYLSDSSTLKCTSLHLVKFQLNLCFDFHKTLRNTPYNIKEIKLLMTRRGNLVWVTIFVSKLITSYKMFFRARSWRFSSGFMYNLETCLMLLLCRRSFRNDTQNFIYCTPLGSP